MYGVRYYPRFHVTAVDLGTYYPWIRGNTCIYRPECDTVSFCAVEDYAINACKGVEA
jgi:hypothetical protein